ncbi:MAG: thermonuclease family protein [Candidatus Paceibacterota bacterium]
MSAHHTPEGVLKYAISGLLLVAFAYLYQALDLTFLNTPAKGGVVNTLGTYYEVTSVIDGDTIHIDMDGVDEKVRFIGINTPETVDPRTQVQCFGKESSERLKDLASGEIVRLEYDDTQSMRDAYGRLLAYVYLEDGQMLNRKMIADGYAYEYTYLTPYKYQSEFRDLQNIARTSGRGLWNEATCGGKK